MSTELQERLLRRILGLESGDAEEIATLSADAVRLISASAFALAMDKRFGENVTADEARLFVERVRGRWVKAEALNPVLAEHIIMAMYEDSNLLGSVPALDVTSAQNLLTYAVTKDLGIAGPGLEDFIDESLEIAQAPDEEVD